MFSLKQLQEIAKSTIENADSLKIFENIVDEDGHERFIEGNGSVEASRTDIHTKYLKWSLSGSHLMLVACFEVDNGATFAGGRPFIFELPQWIMDKIVPVWNNRYIINYTGAFYGDDFTSQSYGCVLDKVDNKLKFYFHTGSLTLTKKRATRIEFDLLIDNE